MKALTVKPGQPGAVTLRDVPEPPPEVGDVLVETLAVGVCGTDREIIAGEYGTAPPGDDYLILGHESLGRVVEAPPGGHVQKGDLVVGIVRMPDPVPCINCAVGEWDMCRNGQYTEHGIKQRHGFCAERYRVPADFVVKLDPGLDRVGVLLEPTSIVAKAWDQIERIGSRSRWQPRRVLVTGAGPVGLLAAMLGVQRGLEVHVVDLVTEGLKPQLVRDLGAQYHVGKVEEVCPGADIVLECTGVGQLVFDVMRSNAPGAIVCLTGLSSGGRALSTDMGSVNNSMVLQNDVVFGSVNANRRHYQMAAEALAKAERGWLERLITRRVPLARWQEIQQRPAGDIKTVIDLTA
jgi:threonine dehydrogenase-like Zn-dependent dehydrogenase